MLKDDGIGVHAVREFKKESLRGILIVEVGTAVLETLHLFEWADKILAIDAMQASGPPGTIYSFGINEIAQNSFKASLHELSLLEAFRFLPKHQSPQVTILGVEPETIDYGIDLSPTLQAIMPRLLQTVKNIIEYWRMPFTNLNNIENPGSLPQISR